MGCNPKTFRNKTPEQVQRQMQRVMSLHRQIAVVNAIGLMIICVAGLAIIGYHLLTK